MKTLREIPDAENRRRYLEAEKKWAELNEQQEAAEGVVEEEMTAELNQARNDFWARQAAIRESYKPKLEAARAELSVAVANAESALDAISEECGFRDRRMSSDYDATVVCALTGLPIFDGDEVIEDDASGCVILKAVLPWPE